MSVDVTRRGPVRRPLRTDVVRDGLRRAIVAGEFRPGSRLPNEEQLCVRYGVSRATVREAVRGLVEAGYLARRQGSGTYVTSRPLLRNSLDVNFSYTEYLTSLGVQAGRRVLGLRSRAAGDDAARLALAETDPVTEVRRVRTADGVPAIYSVDLLPGDIVDAATDPESFGGSLYALLAAAGHPVDHADATLFPAIADASLAAILEVPQGTLLQGLEQVDIDARGRRVMLSCEWHVPSVIELRCIRRGPGATVGAEGEEEGDARG